MLNGQPLILNPKLLVKKVSRQLLKIINTKTNWDFKTLVRRQGGLKMYSSWIDSFVKAMLNRLSYETKIWILIFYFFWGGEAGEFWLKFFFVLFWAKPNLRCVIMYPYYLTLLFTSTTQNRQPLFSQTF